MKIDRAIKYRVTCVSKECIHTMTSLQTDTISETFKEIMADKKKPDSGVKSVEFEPIDKIISYNYTV